MQTSLTTFVRQAPRQDAAFAATFAARAREILEHAIDHPQDLQDLEDATRGVIDRTEADTAFQATALRNGLRQANDTGVASGHLRDIHHEPLTQPVPRLYLKESIRAVLPPPDKMKGLKDFAWDVHRIAIHAGQGTTTPSDQDAVADLIRRLDHVSTVPGGLAELQLVRPVTSVADALFNKLTPETVVNAIRFLETEAVEPEHLHMPRRDGLVEKPPSSAWNNDTQADEGAIILA